MDDARPPPPSLFVALSYDWDAPYCISVLQLENPVNDDEYAPQQNQEQIPVQFKRLQVDQQDYVARFRVPPECPSITWFFSPPTISTHDLYMVPDWVNVFSHPDPYQIHIKPPGDGYKFNFRTGECRPINRPRATKSSGHVVNGRGGHIYYMADPDSYFDTPDPVFECYDPDQDNWKALEPFPDHAVHRRRCSINASAVLDDTILYNMDAWRFWAYNVPKDEWFIVDVVDNRCYNIVGEAVVLGNTIYALTDPLYYRDLVLALSIEREDIAGHLVYKCCLRSEILVPGMDQIKYNVEAHTMTRQLVHLGNDNFCLVQSCELLNYLVIYRYQPIQLTSIKRMGENSMAVTNICVYELEIQDDKQFQVSLCFSLPECKTTAVNEGQRFLFNLDPCHQGHAAYASKQEDKTGFNLEPGVEKPVQAATHVDCAEERHTIYVRNLPPDATVRHLKKELNKFGSIKRDGIRVIWDNTLEYRRLAAYVEFENATSKQDAIEASAIIIEGCRAEIEEKRRLGVIVGSIFCCISDDGVIRMEGRPTCDDLLSISNKS